MKADAGTKSRAPAEVVAHEADATVRLLPHGKGGDRKISTPSDLVKVVCFGPSWIAFRERRQYKPTWPHVAVLLARPPCRAAGVNAPKRLDATRPGRDHPAAG